MKKKLWIPIVICLLLAILLVPVPVGAYDDGGTREYRALTYRIVKWNRLSADGIYQKTELYFGSDCFKSLDTLWTQKNPGQEPGFLAKVLNISGNTVTVEPAAGEWVRQSCDRLTFSTEGLDFTAKVGDEVKIWFTGAIRETYPGQIDVTDWAFLIELQNYPGQWMDLETAKKEDLSGEEHLIIREIYADCFIAVPVIPGPWTFKVNGSITSKWCVGDQVLVSYNNIYRDSENGRMECDMQSIAASSLMLDPEMSYKPVIYLYPEEAAEVDVKLFLNGELTCTYPVYHDGWKVTATPDGTLTDANGQTYNYLYWEGETFAQWDMKTGFCVKGEDTAAFLEEALEKLGLTRREANEFIVYWLPQMQENPYNIISFQSTAYTDAARLEITPSPDTLIRVFMVYHPAEEYVDVEPQLLNAPRREGFTAVEWGGTETSGRGIQD